MVEIFLQTQNNISLLLPLPSPSESGVSDFGHEHTVLLTLMVSEGP